MLTAGISRRGVGIDWFCRMKVPPELEAYKQRLAECDPNRLRWIRVIREQFCRLP